MDTNGAIQLVFLFFLILLSAFFSSAETALTTVNKMRIRSLVEDGNKKAIILQQIIDNTSKMLSAILIGNNIVNISASSLATTLAIRLWGSTSVGIITGVLTLLILVFGEITPKTLATLHSEKISLAYASIIAWLMTLLTPAIYIINLLAYGVLKLLHVDKNASGPIITENELRTIVDVSHEGGVIESEERQMIYNVFDFGDSMAKDIMIPRIDMSCIGVDSSYDELYSVFKEDKYTRVPVFEETTDNIVGIVNIKDLLFIDSKDNFYIRNIMRDAHYTYEYKKTSELMLEMREKSITMAIVLDEYGATVGLITLEDLLEEIVGEIRDEYDEDENDFIQAISELEYMVEGGMKLDDINDALGLSLESEDYDSIGGLIISLLDRLPIVGESVKTESDITLEVAAMDKNRIDKVHMYLPAQIEDEQLAATEILEAENEDESSNK